MPDDRRRDGKTSHRAAKDRAVTRAIDMADGNLDQTHLETLTDGAMSSAWNGSKDALEKVLASGVKTEDIADHYIPAIARSMGEQWCSDELGFASVTIGTSRLQAMLRQLGNDWSQDSNLPPDAPTILVIVAADVYHTLGAMVLSGQLRRKGVSVRLMLGATPPEVASQTARLHFDAIFISASCGETLESLRKIVESIRQDSAHPTPVVVGGTILTEAPDAKTLTGADFATDDPDEALKLCGLDETLRQTLPHRQGS